MIRDEADIRAIERAGLDAFLVDPTPLAILRRAAARWPDACAIRYVPSDGGAETSITFARLLDRVRRAASLFRRTGGGHPVAILLQNTPNAHVALWGAELAGGACPINPMLHQDHIAALLRAARIRTAIVLGRNAEIDVWDRVHDAVRAAGGVSAIFDTDGDDPSPGSDGHFDTLLDLEPTPNDPNPDPGPDPDPDTIAAMFPTGGTTGAPKLTLHTHRNEAFVATAAARMYDLQHGDVMLNGFPLFHVAGAFVYGLSAIAAGATQLVPGRLGMRNRAFVGTIWQQVERYRMTIMSAVPTVMSTLVSLPVDAHIGTLRALYTGGSILPTELADRFERNTGVPVRNILGMTECAGMMTTEPFHGRRTPGSTGLRLPFTQIRVVIPGTGDPCPTGHTGIVRLRGPNVSPGYLDPAAAPGTFLPDGWLDSGDLGHLDDQGRLFITGRAKDVIIRGAHNIDPAAIEDALLRHPDVAVVAAVGQPDAYAGELPVAFVTLKPGATIDGPTLLAFAAAHVPEPAARPKHVWIVDAMPLTPVGKIFKPELRAQATRHAIRTALQTLAPHAGIALLDRTVIVTIPGLDDATAEAVRAALAGMPLAIRVQPEASDRTPMGEPR